MSSEFEKVVSKTNRKIGIDIERFIPTGNYIIMLTDDAWATCFMLEVGKDIESLKSIRDAIDEFMSKPC